MLQDTITTETVVGIAAYCEKVRARLDTFSGDEKRLALDALNLTVQVSGDRKVLHLAGYVPAVAIGISSSDGQ